LAIPCVGGDPVRGDVARERLAGQRVVDHGARREVAVQLRKRRHRPAEGPVHAAQVLVLGAAEEEQAVLLDRPSEREAKILEIELSLDPLAVGVFGREIVRRVELLVADCIEHAARVPIRAALGDDVDRRTRVAAVLGREVRRLHIDLIDEVEADVVDLAGVRPSRG
jgi:hypothetical protein